MRKLLKRPQYRNTAIARHAPEKQQTDAAHQRDSAILLHIWRLRKDLLPERLCPFRRRSGIPLKCELLDLIEHHKCFAAPGILCGRAHQKRRSDQQQRGSQRKKYQFFHVSASSI